MDAEERQAKDRLWRDVTRGAARDVAVEALEQAIAQARSDTQTGTNESFQVEAGVEAGELGALERVWGDGYRQGYEAGCRRGLVAMGEQEGRAAARAGAVVTGEAGECVCVWV